MRYLYATLIALLCSAGHTYAQPGFEAGFASGILMPEKVASTSYASSSSPGFFSSLQMSLLSNALPKKFSLAYGAQLMYCSFSSSEVNMVNVSWIYNYPMYEPYETFRKYRWVQLALPVELRYKKTVGKNVFNAGLAVGPAISLDDVIEFGSSTPTSFISGIASLRAGTTFQKKYSTGIKYTRFLSNYGYDEAKTKYQLNGLQLYGAMLLGSTKRKERSDNWKRAVERHAQMSERMKARKEEKRRQPGKGPNFELGLSGGPAFTNYTGSNTVSVAPKPMELSFMITADAYIDRHPSPVGFTFGGRAGAFGSIVGLGIGIGAKYESKSTSGIQPRAGLFTCAWLFDNSGKFFGLQPNVIAELSAGVLMMKRIYVGLNYSQPFMKFERSYMPSSSYQRYIDYTQVGLMLDLKFRLTKP